MTVLGPTSGLENKDYSNIVNFGTFFVKLPTYSYKTCYTNYYTLARRGKFLVINPFGLFDFFSRIVTFFKQFSYDRSRCNIWTFSFMTKYSTIARWFSWSTRSYVFSRLSREVSIAGKGGQYLCLDGNIASYSFMNFIGVDVAFVLTSQSSNGRASSLTDRGIITIGFDGCLNPIYAYSCPGTRSTRSALMYARFFNLLLCAIFKL